VRLLLNAKRLVVCFCVTALALMSSAGLADLIQIDDLGESIAVSFTSTGFGSIGTITNTGESVVIPYTLIGSVWGGNTFIAIQLIDPAESDDPFGTVSDLWTFRTFDGTPDTIITFSSDPADLSVPPGALLLNRVVETGSYQRLIQGFINVDVRSDVAEPDVAEPGTMALLGLGFAGLGFWRCKQYAARTRAARSGSASRVRISTTRR